MPYLTSKSGKHACTIFYEVKGDVRSVLAECLGQTLNLSWEVLAVREYLPCLAWCRVAEKNGGVEVRHHHISHGVFE